MKSSPPVRVSVIVPCRNESGHIRAFLRSLESQQTGELGWEVLVADGRSDDGTREILEEYGYTRPWLRIIDNPGKIVSTGLNAAIAAARGEIIVRMDAHTEYAPDYVRRSVEVMDETGADNVGGPWRARGFTYMGRAIAAAFSSRFCQGGGRSHQQDYEGPVDTVYLGCWRRAFLIKLGGFDPELVRNQDDELNLRIVRAGGVVWQSPRIASWYYPRRGLSGLFRQYLQYGYWKVAVIRKHGKPAACRHLVPGAFVLMNLLLMAGIGLGAATGQHGVFSAALMAWLLQNSAYLVAVGAASLAVASRSGFRYLPVLPAVLAAYQISYGVGFLLATLRFLPGTGAETRLAGEITR